MHSLVESDPQHRKDGIPEHQSKEEGVQSRIQMLERTVRSLQARLQSAVGQSCADVGLGVRRPHSSMLLSGGQQGLQKLREAASHSVDERCSEMPTERQKITRIHSCTVGGQNAEGGSRCEILGDVRPVSSAENIPGVLALQGETQLSKCANSDNESNGKDENKARDSPTQDTNQCISVAAPKGEGAHVDDSSGLPTIFGVQPLRQQVSELLGSGELRRRPVALGQVNENAQEKCPRLDFDKPSHIDGSGGNHDQVPARGQPELNAHGSSTENPGIRNIGLIVNPEGKDGHSRKLPLHQSPTIGLAIADRKCQKNSETQRKQKDQLLEGLPTSDLTVVPEDSQVRRAVERDGHVAPPSREETQHQSISEFTQRVQDGQWRIRKRRKH